MKTRSICMCLHRVAVCTNLNMVQAGSCQKCEFCNGGGGCTWGLLVVSLSHGEFWESGGV